MALLEVPEEQIHALLGQFSLAARRNALRSLMGSSDHAVGTVHESMGWITGQWWQGGRLALRKLRAS